LELRAVAVQQCQERMEEGDIENEIEEGEEEECSKVNRREMIIRTIGDNAIEESFTKGFLSRYILLLKNIIKVQGCKELKAIAVLSVGKVMLSCKMLAQEMYPLIVELLNSTFTDNSALIISCLTVLADSFSTLPTEAEENSHIFNRYAKHQDDKIASVATTLLQDLMSKKKCKASLQPKHYSDRSTDE